MLHLISGISTRKEAADHGQEGTSASEQQRAVRSAGDCSQKHSHRDHGFPSSLHQLSKRCVLNVAMTRGNT